MNPNSLSGEDKLWGASVVQGKFEYLREVKGVFQNCGHMKSKKCLPEVLLPQLFSAKSWEADLWSFLLMYKCTARSLEILGEAVLSVEKNNLINPMENQPVHPKYCCSSSHNII